MIKHFLRLILLALFSVSAFALTSAEPVTKNGETKQVKTQLKNIREKLKAKSGSDALKGVEELRKDSTQQLNPQLLQYGVEASHLLNDTENEKIYLKSSPDTAAFFNTLYNIYDYALLTDSAETLKAYAHLPQPYRYKFRKSNAELLQRYYKNLSNAPRFFLKKNRWDDAERFSRMSIDTWESALFQSSKSFRNDSAKVVELAVMHVNSCYHQQKYQEIEHFADLALRDSRSYEMILERLVIAETERGDTALYLPHLQQGHQAFPHNMFFFTRLVDYYLTINDNEAVLRAANYSLEDILVKAQCAVNDTLPHVTLPDEDIARFFEARAIAYHNMAQPRKCIEEAKNVLTWDNQHTRADFYIGASYYSLAMQIQIPENISDPGYKKAYLERNRLLQAARPHMELYRRMNEDYPESWAPVLYEIYLYLNLGPEFEEISKYVH